MPTKDQATGKDKPRTTTQATKPDSANLNEAQQQTHPAPIIQRARLDPNSLPASDVLQLQRIVGNKAVSGRLVQRAQQQTGLKREVAQQSNLAQHQAAAQTEQSISQPKLMVGSANDQYEQEADRMAEQGGSMSTPALAPKDDGQAPVQRQEEHVIQQGSGVVQRLLAGELNTVTLVGFREQLTAKGIHLKFAVVNKLFEAVKKSEMPFNTIDEVIAEYNRPGGGFAPIKEIAEVSKEAQKEALEKVAPKEKEAEKGAVAKPKAVIAKKEPKKHKTVEGGGKQLIINLVWLGNNVFGPTEKFNLYSWRALGHTVKIYSHPFAGVTSHTLTTLGLEEGDAELIQLKDTLGADDKAVGDGNPKVSLTDARSILKKWLGAIPGDGKPKLEHIFNMVDLTKSYIGGTQQGITLDAKVGPSVHLQDYADSFSNKLISYTRGGNTAEVPENQSMGTMQESDELRNEYATRFNDKVKTLKDADHNAAWFNELTGYHGRSYYQTKKWLDVAIKTPLGGEAEREFEVGEIGPLSHGPFRVFKRATDQTNKAGLKTHPKEIRSLAEEVYKKEIVNSGGNQKFIDKALAAQIAMPTETAEEKEAREKKEAEGK